MKFEYKEETPSNIEELKKKSKSKNNADIRLESISELGSWKCRQSIDILWRLMINDKVFSVQEQAFLRLQAFGENVKLPRKKKGKLVKDIETKINKSLESSETSLLFQEFKELFNQRNLEEFDIYKHDKGIKFDTWLKNIIKNLPLELRNKISDL